MAFGMLYPSLSHYLQGRVHVSDPMGGHDGDSTVGPGIFLPLAVICFALCSFFSEYLLVCSCSLYP